MRLTPASGRVVLVPLTMAVAAAVAHGQVTFQSTGVLPIWYGTIPTAISADGTTVVGWALDLHYAHAPFRWTASGGPELLAPQSEPGALDAVAVSADGSVVLGRQQLWRTYRWTAKTGFVRLPPDYPGGPVTGHGITADGFTIVGTAGFTWGSQGFWWNPTTNLRSLGGMYGPAGDSYVSGCSADGTVLCGTGIVETGRVAFRWTAQTGFVQIGDLPGGPVYAEVFAISADGTTIVGMSRSARGREAFRWTAAGGMQGLGLLPGTTICAAAAVSGDGSVVVGTSSNDAFIWTAQDGLRNLRDVLLAAGLTAVTDWDLASATGISADGRVMTGQGRRYLQRPNDYVSEGWVATLGPSTCYANCDGSAAPPVLNVNDFLCFLNQFSAGRPYANCDGSSFPPALNVLDFLCFQQRFAAGCP